MAPGRRGARRRRLQRRARAPGERRPAAAAGHRQCPAVPGQRVGGDPDGRARRGARPAEQAQRNRPRHPPSPRPVGPAARRGRPLAGLRDDGALGVRAADGGFRPARGAAHRRPLAARLFRLALQGIAVAQHGRAPGLRRLAQELRDGVPLGSRVAGRAGRLQQPVERAEIGRGRPAAVGPAGCTRR